MREVFVTSFAGNAATGYGRQMVDSVQRHFGPVVAYLDVPCDLPCETRSTRDLDGWSDFRMTIYPPPASAVKPDNYIWQTRFAVKAFIWQDMAERMGTGVLVWIDGDTEATATPGPGFFEARLGHADVAYLGRGDMHPETGVVVFRLPEALPVITACRDAYLSGAFTALDGWTDCHVLRSVLRGRGHDLTSHAADGWTSRVDAMALSPFGPFLTHHKGGARKRALCAS